MSAPQKPTPPITTTTTTTNTAPSNLLSSFNNSATTYERRIGRATRAIAAHIVASILPTLSTHALILDNACGTGAIASATLQRYPSAQIRCVDASPDMIDIMHAEIRSNGWANNVSAAVMSGQDLKFGDSTFDASVTNFGIFFFPDPVAGASEIRRTLKGGGMAVVTCWRYLLQPPFPLVMFFLLFAYWSSSAASSEA
jgi:ubiquinone/menaquinone biosynthesis C-methylase UbiE